MLLLIRLAWSFFSHTEYRFYCAYILYIPYTHPHVNCQLLHIYVYIFDGHHLRMNGPRCVSFFKIILWARIPFKRCVAQNDQARQEKRTERERDRKKRSRCVLCAIGRIALCTCCILWISASVAERHCWWQTRCYGLHKDMYWSHIPKTRSHHIWDIIKTKIMYPFFFKYSVSNITFSTK